MTGRIEATSTAMLRAMAGKAKGDALMLVCLLKLSEAEGAKQMRRVEAALGITKADRAKLTMIGAK